MFVNHTSTVMCMEGVNHQLLLEPRDRYGNLCLYSPEASKSSSFSLTLTEVSSSFISHPFCGDGAVITES